MTAPPTADRSAPPPAAPRVGGRSRSRLGTTLPVAAILGIVLLVALGHRSLEAPVLALLPVAPAVAALLAGPRAGWWTLGWTALGVLLLGLFRPPEAPVGAMLRAALLLGVSGLGVALIGRFEREVDRLRGLLRSTASHDELTGLANRGSLDDTLALEHHRLARHPTSALSLILLGLDHFQSFNDIHGHATGDEVLQRVASTVLTRVRRATDVLARYGGDELLAVLPATTRGEAAAVAECIRRDVEALGVEHRGSPAGIVTVSLGVAAAEADAPGSVDAMLTRADTALAESKRTGRNRVTVAD